MNKIQKQKKIFIGGKYKLVKEKVFLGKIGKRSFRWTSSLFFFLQFPGNTFTLNGILILFKLYLHLFLDNLFFLFIFLYSCPLSRLF